MAGQETEGTPARNGQGGRHREPTLPGPDFAVPVAASAFWRFDLDSGALTWAPPLPALLGLPAEQVQEIRSRLKTLVAPLTVAARSFPVWEDFDLVQEHATPEGTAKWIRLRARKTRNGTGGDLVGIATDVTEAPEAAREQSDIAERYRLLVELTPDAICVHQDGKVVYVNSAAVRLLRANSANDLIGRRIFDFVPSADIPALQNRLDELKVPGAAAPPTEIALQQTGGGTRIVESVTVRTMWHGRPAYQAILRDVTAQRAAEEALHYRAALVSHVSDAIISTTTTGEVTSWNPAAAAVYGHREASALGRPVAELVGAELDPEAILSAGGVTEATHHHADGTELMVRVSAAAMNDGYVLVCADETARRLAEQRYSSVVMALDEGVLVIGGHGLIEAVNPAAERILGLPAQAMIGASPSLLPVHDEEGNPLPVRDYSFARTQRTGEPRRGCVMRVWRPDGKEVWLSVNCRLLDPTSPPHPTRPVVVSFTDITDRKAIGEQLTHDATHDSLTGLANRAHVLTRLDSTLGPGGRTHRASVLFIDLDRFKVVNDSLGHGVGDDVLRIVGGRLREAVRGNDLVGRLGGDEFVVVTAGLGSDDEAAVLAGRIRRALLPPIVVDRRRVRLDASIGIVTAEPGDRRNAEDLIRDADVAMYRAKSRGGCRFEFFDVQLRKLIQRHQRLEQDLRDALYDKQIWFAYQPIVSLATSEIVAVEALMRWDHPVFGPISPGEFIPIAEQSDLIYPVGTRVLRATTAELAARRKQHDLDIMLSVNLSVRQLEDPTLVPTVRDVLAETGLPTAALCLEITESALMREPESAAKVLHALRELGVRLAIDDFGTGYSSLAQLWRLPLDILKIDRAFVDALGQPGEDGAEWVVKGAITTAHDIGLTVIAEGTETEQQLDILRELGCDLAQGYRLGRPTTTAELWDA